jgi:hypothetical protein
MSPIALVKENLGIELRSKRQAPLKLAYKKKAWAKTYNSGYSLVVTHLTTNPPVRCLNRAERTGSLVFNVLWSYVEDLIKCNVYIHKSDNEGDVEC